LRKSKVKIKPLDIVILVLLFAVGVYIAYRIKVQLHYKWHWSAMPKYFFRYDEETGKWVINALVQGLLTTIRLSIWGSVFATIIGTVIGLFRVSHVLFLRLVARVYVELIRNTPPLVLIFIFYFFIGDQIIPVLGVDDFIRGQSPQVQRVFAVFFATPGLFSAFFSALLTLSLLEGAYIAEIVRAGIQSVERGQWEASMALGLSRWQQMRYVILPQAIQRILPPLAGQFISLIKDSSIVSIISIQELTFQATELMAATYFTIEIWVIVAVLYLALTLTCSLAVERLEIRMASSQ